MKPKRLLFLTSHRTAGGAAMALDRIREKIKQREDLEVVGLYIDNATSKGLHRLGHHLASNFERILKKLLGLKTEKSFFSFSFFSSNQRKILDAARRSDLIFLGWINNSFLSLNLVGELSKLNKPMFWRLSDMWPFTGGCHYSGGCEGYQEACGYCPNGFVVMTSLVTRHQLQQKTAKWRTENITIIAPSAWINDLSKSSKLFRNVRHEIVRTGVDLDVFQPINPRVARAALKLPFDKFLIGASADKLQMERKGIDLLISSLNRSTQKHRFECVFFGKIDERILQGIDFAHHWIGHLSDERDLNTAYSSLDLYAAPSREENLANTVLESMASGVPVIAFDIGGMPEAITDRVNGYLVAPFDLDQMTAKIEEHIDRDDHSVFRRRARETVSRRFDLSKSVDAIRKLILAECGRAR